MSRLDPILWARVEAVLDDLLDLAPDARSTALARLAIVDPELHPHLVALLNASDRNAGPLDVPAAALIENLLVDEQVAEDAVPAAVPEVPRYRIRQEIGSGGMGSVYLAERSDGAFEQTVALKVLRHGLDTAEINRRFRLERRILARLDHPGIAGLLDGGVTNAGRPYFVMEYVDGRPITEFADQEALSVPERVDLFIDVCAAVAHAQRHLIVHRDLKPSNILVTATRTVKLLDFGIAKPLDAMGDEPLDVTQPGDLLMTPAYAAPEQLSGMPVTTATDVYALGCVLYELLGGVRPLALDGHPAARLRAAILAEEAQPLRRPVPADLARVVAMAMRKDPARRYASAADLMQDLRNWRTGRPVIARGDSASYRGYKFLRRNRGSVVAAALVILALAGGLAGTAWQARQATQQAIRATAVKDFLNDLFVAVDPDHEPDRELSVGTLFARGVERIDADTSLQPEVRAELLHLLGSLQLKLGKYEIARQLLERSVSLRTALHGPDDQRTIDAVADLGSAAVYAGDYAVGESLLTRALAHAQRARRGPEPTTARYLNDLGVIRHRLADHTGAEEYYRAALTIDREVYGDLHLEIAVDLDNIAVVLVKQDRLEEAIALHRESLAIRRQLVRGDHSSVGTGLHNLAFALSTAGDIAAADSLLQEAIAMRRRLYPDGHPNLAASLQSLARLEYGRGRHAEAETLLAEALAMNQRLLDPQHEDIAAVLNELGMVAVNRGDLQAGEKRFAASLTIWKQTLPPGHPTLLTVQNNLAYTLRMNGKYAAAEQLVRRILQSRIASLGPLHPQVAYDHVLLGIVLRYDRRPHAALEELLRALTIRLADLGRTEIDLAHTRFHLGAALSEAGRAVEAEEPLRAALAAYLVELAPDAPRLAEARCALGSCLLALGRRIEALPLLEAGLQVLGTDLAKRDPVARRAPTDLATARHLGD